ncbi:MAG: MFS transporter, partial [Magnetospiraceae bacterium]
MIRPLHWTGNSPISPQGVALRIGGYYVAFFITMGTFLPYAAVWLADEGFTPSQIATLFALVALSRLVAAPAASHVADRLGARRRPMIFLSLAAFGAYALPPCRERLRRFAQKLGRGAVARRLCSLIRR